MAGECAVVPRRAALSRAACVAVLGVLGHLFKIPAWRHLFSAVTASPVPACALCALQMRPVRQVHVLLPLDGPRLLAGAWGS
jgi:hypothetical protein